MQIDKPTAAARRPAARFPGARWLLLAVAAIALAGCSLFGIRTAEEPGYRIVEIDDAIELREYPGYVTVETVVDGDFETAGNRAFGKLFGYISGDNRARAKIDMTAPVVAAPGEVEAGEKIDMTAPVIADSASGGWRYAFVLPADFTIDNAPLPLDPDLRLVDVPPHRVATIGFSGTGQESLFQAQAARLHDWMADHNLVPAAKPRFASYDPPWTLPSLRRNEVLITVESR